jgi:hypothetical protein
MNENDPSSVWRPIQLAIVVGIMSEGLYVSPVSIHRINIEIQEYVMRLPQPVLVSDGFALGWVLRLTEGKATEQQDR